MGNMSGRDLAIWIALLVVVAVTAYYMGYCNGELDNQLRMIADTSANVNITIDDGMDVWRKLGDI